MSSSFSPAFFLRQRDTAMEPLAGVHWLQLFEAHGQHGRGKAEPRVEVPGAGR